MGVEARLDLARRGRRRLMCRLGSSRTASRRSDRRACTKLITSRGASRLCCVQRAALGR